jgi:site-specific recombinase XerD
MRRWDHLMEQYLGECATRGLAEGTLIHRRRELERWGSWLKRKRPTPRLEGIDAPLVIDYVRARMAFRSKWTVSSTMSEMRGMGEFLVREGIWRRNPLRWLRGPKLDARMRVPRRIGREQMERLWEAAAMQRTAYHRQLWTTVLSVLYGTGLRRGELVRLELSSWDRSTGILELDGHKTGWVRRVPVPRLVAECLEAYLPVRQHQLERFGLCEQAALFVNGHGRRLEGEGVSKAVAGLARRAGLEGVTLHAFRHTCASDLLEAGVRVPEVAQVLGHRVLATTVRYLHIADPERHAAIGRHPINDWLRGEAA